MFETIITSDFWVNFFSGNDIGTFFYEIITLFFIFGITIKAIFIYKENPESKVLFFIFLFLISCIFEFIHVFSPMESFSEKYLNVFFSRFVQCLALLGLFFIQEETPEYKLCCKDYLLMIISIIFVIKIVIFKFDIPLMHFSALLNSLMIFAYISVFFSFVFIKILQKQKIFTGFNLGIFLLAMSSAFFLNEEYLVSLHRQIVYMLRFLGELLIFLNLYAIKEDFTEYRFRLKLILLPTLYMIMFFAVFVMLGNFLFDLNFTEKIFTSFILFYFLSLITQFVFVSNLTMPLTTISQSLNYFKPGEPPKFIDIKTKDEVEILARNINKVYSQEWEYTQEINEKQKQIQELMKSRESFVAALSHDLKSPIFSEQKIIEFILMDKDAVKVSDFIEYLEEMYQINEEVLRIVNNILTTYHIDSEELKLNKIPTNINKLIKDAAQTLRFVAEDKNINIVLNLDPNIPLVNVDEDMIKRVIVNLLSNSIKHSKTSTEVKIATLRKDKKVEVSIQDFGKGISLEDQKNIFQKYPMAKSKVGSGLGLYISKRILDVHNGKIWFESKEGEGITFFFTLPF